jgi:hypothetical protein
MSHTSAHRTGSGPKVASHPVSRVDRSVGTRIKGQDALETKTASTAQSSEITNQQLWQNQKAIKMFY